MRPAGPRHRPAYARLLSHVFAVTNRAEALAIDPDTTAWLLSDTGLYLWQRAEHEQARRLFERSLAIREARQGPDHPHTAIGVTNLANVLRDQGDLDGARPLYERALAIREAHLSPDNPDTAQSSANLAVVLHDQGDLAGARPLYERALAVFEARLGPDHPDTAWCLTHLAVVLRDQGDLDGARSFWSAPSPSARLAWAPTTPTQWEPPDDCRSGSRPDHQPAK